MRRQLFVALACLSAVFQAGAVGFLAGRVGEMVQIRAGFALMGTGIALITTAQTKVLVFVSSLCWRWAWR